MPELEPLVERIRQAGGHVLGEIETMPWGERMFYATDPFGGRISFVEASTVFTGAK